MTKGKEGEVRSGIQHEHEAARKGRLPLVHGHPNGDLLHAHNDPVGIKYLPAQRTRKEPKRG